MEREMRFHLERETEENMRRGMPPTSARRAALLSFGGVERFKEECRDVQRPRRLETFWQDVQYGVRMLRKYPSFTLLAVLTLALGIGVNTSIFSVVYGVLLRPLPYRNGHELVVLRQQAPLAGADNLGFSVKEIEDYRAQNQALEGIVEHHSMTFTLLGGQEPELIQTGVVSANFFDVMGVKPLLGRTFLPEDEAHGAEAVLVLSYKYWQRSQHGDRDIVGKRFRMNDRPHTVIGVLPPVPQYPNENDVYMPTAACPTRSSERFMANRNARMMSVFGRRKPGVPLAQAQTDVATNANRMQQQYPDVYPANRGFRAVATDLQDELTQQARQTFLLLLGTAGLVLLIACANVANLALARVLRREREMAVRAALGASRGRLIRLLLTESTLLALLGGALGIVLAIFSTGLLVKFAERFTPRAHEIGVIDGTVLGFALAISLLTGLVFGLAPALSIGQNLVPALKDGSGQSTASPARQRLRNSLVVAQVAVSFALLIVAGLMTRSLLKLQQVKPGFDVERVLVMRISPNWSKYQSNEDYRTFSQRLLDKLKTQPGVLIAALSNNYPLNPLGITRGPNRNELQIEGRPLAPGELPPQADFRVVTPDYFDTLRLPLVSGRLFNDLDYDPKKPVALINQALARHRFGNDDPVGHRLSLDRGESWATIVGVVADVKSYGLQSAAVDEVYRPVAQTFGAGFLLARTKVEPAGLIRQLRGAVYDFDPETAIDHVRTLEDARSEALASPRLTATLLSLFAALALLITAAGIAGVMALAVAQRTHEIGIRLALGASKSAVLWLVLEQGMRLVLVGLAVGSSGALVLTRVLSAWMNTLLFAVEPADPLTYLLVALVLAAAAAAACYLPARRVTGINPMIALRSE
ncbi:MAG: ABC transporter permease [Acidobacteria bacterium]|nr:ABC transporter permease [Acidobacteriota bacterium]